MTIDIISANPDAVTNGVPTSLRTADGQILAATRFSPLGAPKARLIMAGATGVPQGFYRRFAQFAAAVGFDTMTFDYRGVGLSRPASLKGYEVDLPDWGRQDLAAVIDAMATPGSPLLMMGHSVGGHALGLAPNHDKVAAFCGFGVGSGWHGWMPPVERWKVLTMWHAVLPPLTSWKGYSPWKALGMGEDLPSSVFWQWRHWCRFPRYFFDDPEVPEIREQFATVTTPLRLVNALDDLWALPVSRDAFAEGYSRAPITRVDLHPDDVEGANGPLRSIGHMGYFRPGATRLWSEALDWLTQTASARSAA